MAITNYIRPQTEIYQQLEITIEVTHGYLAACVIGPQYDLYRYGKEELPAIPFSSAEQLVPFTYYQDRLTNYEVDLDSVTVIAEHIQASLAKFGDIQESKQSDIKVDPADRYVIRLTNGKCFASKLASNIDSRLANYGVQISDVVAVTAKNGSKEDDEYTQRLANVVDLVGKVIPANVTLDKDAQEIFELKSEPTDYTGLKDTTFNFVVTESSDDQVSIEVTDTAGVAVARFLQVDEDGTVIEDGKPVEELDLGLGVKISAKEGIYEKLTVGSIYSVSAVAVSEDPDNFDGLRLDTMPAVASIPVEDVLIGEVDIRIDFSGEVPGSSPFSAAYTVTEEGVNFNEELSVYIPDQKRYAKFVDGIGTLYIQFRVLVMPQDEEEDIFYLEDETSVIKAFGPIDQRNDLAYAAATCLKGASGRGIYALRVSGRPDDKDAYLAALQKTQTNRTCYSFSVITDDYEVAHAVSLWNEEQCAPDIKNYRRTIWGVDTPDMYVSATVDQSGLPLRAMFVDVNADSDTTNATLVQLEASMKFNLRDYTYNKVTTQVRPGDFVKINLTGALYEVKRVTSKQELELVNGPKSEITTPTEITIYKNASAANMTEYIQGVCSNFGSRRATVVFCDGGMHYSEVVQNKYLGAYIAGLSSAVVPQQSITRSEVTALTSCARMYTKYTRKQLDEIARYGCLLITQDAKHAPCYVRHQLTTETDKGVLYYEESCTRNVDNISFALDEEVSKFIGRANITYSALSALERSVMSVLGSFKSDSTDPLIGPSLVDYSDLTIRQDPVYKDRVNITVKLYIPAPLNNIRIFELVYVAEINIENA